MLSIFVKLGATAFCAVSHGPWKVKPLAALAGYSPSGVRMARPERKKKNIATI
jgi:hypothetical protein